MISMERMLYFKCKLLPIIYKFDLLEKRGERIELIQMNFSTRNWFSRLEYITYNPNYIKITEEEYNMHLEL